MSDMWITIAEYEQSCRALRERIRQLNDRISGRVPMGADETEKMLTDRRYLLYGELVDMEYAIRQMREYLEVTEDNRAAV